MYTIPLYVLREHENVFGNGRQHYMLALQLSCHYIIPACMWLYASWQFVHGESHCTCVMTSSVWLSSWHDLVTRPHPQTVQWPRARWCLLPLGQWWRRNEGESNHGWSETHWQMAAKREERGREIKRERGGGERARLVGWKFVEMRLI